MDVDRDALSRQERSSTTELYRDQSFNPKTKQHFVENLSIKTPFSNISETQSKYAGNNAALKNWYSAKLRNIGKMTKGSESAEYPEIYSQFSKGSMRQLRNPLSQTPEVSERKHQEAFESLRKNEYFPKITFDEFLERKKTGKRALFYLKPTKSQQVELY